MTGKEKREFLDSYDVLIDAIEHCALVRQYDQDEEYQLYINQIKDLKTSIVKQMTSPEDDELSVKIILNQKK